MSTVKTPPAPRTYPDEPGPGRDNGLFTYGQAAVGRWCSHGARHVTHTRKLPGQGTFRTKGVVVCIGPSPFGGFFCQVSKNCEKPSASCPVFRKGRVRRSDRWPPRQRKDTQLPALRTLLAVVATAVAAALTPVAAAATAPAPPTPHAAEHVCPQKPRPGEVTCFALQRTDVKGAAGVHANAAPAGYGPSDLVSAYNLPSGTAGAGQTVAIVDAYDDPNAEADLAVYRAAVRPAGLHHGQRLLHARSTRAAAPTTRPPNAGWAEEISLDLDMVSRRLPQLPHPPGRGRRRRRCRTSAPRSTRPSAHGREGRQQQLRRRRGPARS